MLPGLYSAATGLNVALRTHEVAADNLAHMARPGHRRLEIAMQSFEQTLFGQTNPIGLGTHTIAVQTDFTPGPVVTTGRKLDVALDGQGFFELQGPEGPRYTRSGVFFVDGERQLVSAEGLPVMGAGGPIRLPTQDGLDTLHIARDGTISLAQNPVGRLKAVDFENPSQLIQVSPSLFALPPGVRPLPLEATVRQGAREMSNVSPLTELVHMIAGMRHYEAAERVLRAISETVQQQTSPAQA